MMKPAWLDKLNDEQINYAAQIADKARELGIPESLAVALAYHESGLNPAKTGAAKEIGLMQVLPSTGEMLGYKPEDLRDPAKNIEAGLKYLKQQLDTFQAPELAALAYNRGPGVAEKFIAGEEDAAGQKYVKSVQALGGFSGVQPEEPAEQAPTIPPTTEETASEEDLQAQKMAGMAGAGAGAALGAKRFAGEQIGKAAQFLGQQAETGRMAAQAAGAAQQAGGLPGAKAPAGGLPAPNTTIAAGPDIRATGVGKQNINYGLSAGLSLSEAQQAIDMTKKEGGAHDLLRKKREGEMLAQKMFPNMQFEQDPITGLYTDVDQEQKMKQIVAEHQAQQAAKATAAQQAAAQQAAKPAGALEKVSQSFRNMSGAVGRTLNRLAGPLALYSTGTEAVAGARELGREDPSYTAAAASGLGALGGVLSAFPATAPVGIPLSIAGPAIRESIQETRARAIPEQERGRFLRQPIPQPDFAKMVR